MTGQNIDFTQLCAIPIDAEFAASSYQHLLGRSAGPSEILYSVRMLHQGLSRKGYLYWITRSEEFKLTGLLPELEKGKFDCFCYKAFEKLRHLFHQDALPRHRQALLHPSTDSTFCGNPVWSAAASPDDSSFDNNFDAEYSALANAQMSKIPEAFPADLTASRFVTCGYLARKLLPADAVCAQDVSFDMLYHADSDADSVFLTNPSCIYSLFQSEDRLSTLSRKIKDLLVFTMPVLPSFQGLSIIWDNGWFVPEQDLGGHTVRWSRGDRSSQKIFLINHLDQTRRIRLSFMLNTLTSDSEIELRYRQSCSHVSFSPVGLMVSLELWLMPGCNTLSFTYIGTKAKPCGVWGRSVSFSIADMHLSELANHHFAAIECPENDLYGNDSSVYGTGYFPYLLPDSCIRAGLHRCGFFEVQAFRISSLYEIDTLAKTRFLNASESCGKECYYTCSQNTPPAPVASGPDVSVPDVSAADDSARDVSSVPGVVLYVAHRTATFQEDIS